MAINVDRFVNILAISYNQVHQAAVKEVKKNHGNIKNEREVSLIVSHASTVLRQNI